jgi:hypothetical protein
MEKICKTCKHWKNFNDLSGTCDKTRLVIDGDLVDENGKKLDDQYPPEPYDFPELCCDSDVENLASFENDYPLEVDEFSVSELFSSIRILFGSNFCCNNWEK